MGCGPRRGRLAESLTCLADGEGDSSRPGFGRCKLHAALTRRSFGMFSSEWHEPLTPSSLVEPT
eukprot:3325572-Pyramimonas_sp.AAC.1